MTQDELLKSINKKIDDFEVSTDQGLYGINTSKLSVEPELWGEKVLAVCIVDI